MSCCGNFPRCMKKSDVDKCTDSISNLMKNDEYRQRFATFLETRHFIDELEAFNFVVECDEIIEKLERVISRRGDLGEGHIRRTLTDLATKGEEVALALYESEVNRLNSILTESDPGRIRETLLWVRGRGLESLDQHHKAFSVLLCREFNSQSCCS